MSWSTCTDKKRAKAPASTGERAVVATHHASRWRTVHSAAGAQAVVGLSGTSGRLAVAKGSGSRVVQPAPDRHATPRQDRVSLSSRPFGNVCVQTAGWRAHFTAAWRHRWPAGRC